MSFTSHVWVRTSRKERRCVWCTDMIPAKSACRSDAGICEGEFYSGHLHPECAAAYDSLTPKEWDAMDHQYSPGDFARGSTAERRPHAPPMFSSLYRGRSLALFTFSAADDATPAHHRTLEDHMEARA